jgi:hypothetical protein
MLNSKCHFIEEKQENIKKFVQPVQRFLIIEVCDARALNNSNAVWVIKDRIAILNAAII